MQDEFDAADNAARADHPRQLPEDGRARRIEVEDPIHQRDVETRIAKRQRLGSGLHKEQMGERESGFRVVRPPRG